MYEVIRTIVEWMLILIALVGYYVTSVHYKWWRMYRPSPLIRHLLISSIAVDTAATISAILATFLIVGIQLDRSVSLTMLAFSLAISLGVKIYRRWDLRALDHPERQSEPEGHPLPETRNQREDREFGQQRRDLEQEHTNNGFLETNTQREDREFVAQHRELHSVKQDVQSQALREANHGAGKE